MKRKLNAGDEFIDQLLLKYRVSLRRVYKFADEHMKELEQAENIFELKDDNDKKLCLVLFRLMAGKNSLAISKFFCDRYHINDYSIDDLFFEEHKLFLISAFIYNPSFFAASWNLCGIIISHLAYEAEAKKETQKPQNGTVVIIVFQRFIPAEHRASSAAETLKEIWSEDIDQDGIQGKLLIEANAGIVKFSFIFKEYRSEPPYNLRVHYKTQSDNVEHTAELNVIEVNSVRNRELIITSVPQHGIRYEDGFTITNLEVQKIG
jgi:hypothetical protein